jgi:hypothetical protein
MTEGEIPGDEAGEMPDVAGALVAPEDGCTGADEEAGALVTTTEGENPGEEAGEMPGVAGALVILADLPGEELFMEGDRRVDAGGAFPESAGATELVGVVVYPTRPSVSEGENPGDLAGDITVCPGARLLVAEAGASVGVREGVTTGALELPVGRSNGGAVPTGGRVPLNLTVEGETATPVTQSVVFVV